MSAEDFAWLDYRARFADVYDESNYASPLQAAVMRASHRATERQFGSQHRFDNVLEVGGGTGEHLPFVQHQFNRYVLTDVDPATLEVARAKLAPRYREKLSLEVQSCSDLGYEDDSFDRLIGTHVLEHMYQPHLVLKEWRRVVRDGGIISILIPTDPGMAWRLGRHLGPRRNAIAQGIEYDYVMAREHVNPCNNLVALIRHYFPDRKEAWWPLSVPSIDMNLFFVCHVTCRKTK